MDSDVLTEVPQSMKRLVRLVARGFYSIEHALVIDMLVRNPCMKEDDMLELLKFDRKQLRAVINTLKIEKFIKVRMRVETDADGRTTRHNYYFISYIMFVNVVKYKLDHVRRKIEMEERCNTSRASFRCDDCQKTFTDLEADQLFDFFSQTFKYFHKFISLFYTIQNI
jgi:transcription initiation factor TFIIE subunit alpha